MRGAERSAGNTAKNIALIVLAALMAVLCAANWLAGVSAASLGSDNPLRRVHDRLFGGATGYEIRSSGVSAASPAQLALGVSGELVGVQYSMTDVDASLGAVRSIWTQALSGDALMETDEQTLAGELGAERKVLLRYHGALPLSVVSGWMGGGEKKFLSRFVVNIAVPCNCLVGLLNNLKHEDLARAGQMMVFTVGGIVLTLALSALAATLLQLPRSRWGVFVPMAGLSNVLFVGLPLCTQLFGEVCIPYVMVYYLSNTIFTQSLAVVLIERAGSRPGKGGGLAHRMLDMLRKPPIVGMAVSIVLLVLGLRPPELVMRFASQISGSVTPLALIYCGYIVYEVGLKNLRFLRGMPTMLIIRLIISPLICAAFCTLGGVSGLAMRVFIVESALPVVSQITVMAGAYGADEEYAATGACLSMLGCFLTIPVLMVILS